MVNPYKNGQATRIVRCFILKLRPYYDVLQAFAVIVKHGEVNNHRYK